MIDEPKFLADAVWSVSSSWWLIVGVLVVFLLVLRIRWFKVGMLRQNTPTDKVGFRLLASHREVQIYSLEVKGLHYTIVQTPHALLQLDPEKTNAVAGNARCTDEADK